MDEPDSFGGARYPRAGDRIRYARRIWSQLEKWNGDTLALASPTAGQFVTDEAALAALDVTRLGGGGAVQTAALVVPSVLAPIGLGAGAGAGAGSGAGTAVAMAQAAPALAQAATAMPAAAPAVIKAAVAPRSAPMMAKLADAARGAAAVAKVRPQAVAMLDRKLLSDDTLGSILAKARAESRLR